MWETLPNNADSDCFMTLILPFDLWDLEIVFHSSQNQFNNTEDQVRGNSSRNTPSNKHARNQTKTPIQHDILELGNVDYVSSNAKSSRFGAMLYIFEDNEAVIKMIIKGRSPTRRRIKNPQSCSWLVV